MFSKRTDPRSIASQLIVLFTLAATLLLSCGLGVFYWIVVRHAFAEDNAILADKISALSADFNESGPKIFGQELKAYHAGERAPYWIRVLDSEGRTVTETPGMDRLLASVVFPPAQRSISSVRSRRDYRAGARLFSLIAVNEEAAGRTYTIQVAQDRSSDEQVERTFGVLLVVVLAGSMVGAGREPVERTRFHGRSAVEKIATFCQTIAEDHHVAISCSGEGQIYADPALFERAVGNLVDNALRFTPKNGSIQIALAEHAADFQIAVSDNGCGIGPEHLPRVFDRFYRAESSRRSDGGGLGLALVK